MPKVLNPATPQSARGASTSVRFSCQFQARLHRLQSFDACRRDLVDTNSMLWTAKALVFVALLFAQIVHPVFPSSRTHSMTIGGPDGAPARSACGGEIRLTSCSSPPLVLV